ncbi:hypothetical protein FA95DRAFT_1563754 [Auriscalpium vulgare]|uniref:Uncharacterized protein n=1 Tax=Auriscalpium vulgare TaxID=40419 RepID=A0ACB8RFQ5_9AGAM|nr:hypothetical protein FA95DRAFT_1563754 [Auriscalpium vulgare]
MAIIPLDIQLLVVEWLYRLSQHQFAIDYHTLRACALVCSAWRPVAQRLLFRRVPRQPGLPFGGIFLLDVTLLLDILRTRPHLAAHVRTIRLFLESAYADAVDAQLMLLEVCPHVACLYIEIDTEIVPHMLKFAIPQHIQSVILPFEHEDVNAILKLWPDLRAIEITRGVIPGVDEIPLIRIPSGVLSLSVPASVITQIFVTADDLPALRDLELGAITSRSYTELLPTLCASGLLPRLRTLVLDGPLPPAEVLDQLEQLESLIFQELPNEDVIFPKTLRHIGCHYSCDPEPERASFLVAALRSLDGLQLVTVAGLFRRTRAVLMDACRELDVECVTLETSEHFPRPRDVDWI